MSEVRSLLVSLLHIEYLSDGRWQIDRSSRDEPNSDTRREESLPYLCHGLLEGVDGLSERDEQGLRSM